MIKANDIKEITNDKVNTVISRYNKSAIVIPDQNKTIYDSLFSVDETEFNDIINKTPRNEENRKQED